VFRQTEDRRETGPLDGDSEAPLQAVRRKNPWGAHGASRTATATLSIVPVRWAGRTNLFHVEHPSVGRAWKVPRGTSVRSRSNCFTWNGEPCEGGVPDRPPDGIATIRNHCAFGFRRPRPAQLSDRLGEQAGFPGSTRPRVRRLLSK